MVTKEQFINGLVNYVDSEVLPALPTAQKWAVGAAVILAKNRADELISNLATNSVVKALGLIGPTGLIDDEALSTSLSESASKYGSLTVNIPFTSAALTFNSADIEKAHGYICKGA